MDNYNTILKLCNKFQTLIFNYIGPTRFGPLSKANIDASKLLFNSSIFVCCFAGKCHRLLNSFGSSTDIYVLLLHGSSKSGRFNHICKFINLDSPLPNLDNCLVRKRNIGTNNIFMISKCILHFCYTCPSCHT